MNSKSRLLLSILLPGLLLSACSSAVPSQGEEAVLVRKPWFFGHGGVDATPIRTGRSWIAMSTSVVIVNMMPQEFHEEFADLMSSDGIPLDFDSHIRLQVTDSVRLVERFGEQWYANNVKNQFRNFVRQEVRRHGMNETAIDTSAVDSIDREVSRQMEQYLRQAQIPVRLIGVTVGRANPPDAIKNQRVRTASEQQRRITEEQTRQAEDARLEAERARARADNAYRESMSLSPEQFIELERIKMMQAVCTGQNRGNCTFIDGVANPIIAR